MIKWDSFQEMQGWHNICKTMTGIYHVKESKDKRYIIISMDGKIYFEKIHYAFMLGKCSATRGTRNIPCE